MKSFKEFISEGVINERSLEASLGVRKVVEGEDYKTVVDRPDVKVYRILTFEGSRAIGGNRIGYRHDEMGGTVKWSIVANEQYFEQYIHKFDIFYVMDLKNDEKYGVLCKHDDKSMRIYDTRDREVSFDKLTEIGLNKSNFV